MSTVHEGSVFTIRSHGAMQDLRLGVYCDAARVRPDGSSQGGTLMFLANQSGMSGEAPFPLMVIDWSSKELMRMRRSSLSAEAQLATIAIDELEWAKVFYASMVRWPGVLYGQD